MLEIDLTKNTRIDQVSNHLGIHIVVEDGAVFFTESECPDHICEQYGRLTQPGDTAVCLPAKAVLEVKE